MYPLQSMSGQCVHAIALHTLTKR